MNSMLMLFRIIAILSSIVFMIVSIRAKDKSKLQCILWCTLGNLGYLAADLFIFPFAMDLAIGLDVIAYGIGFIIAGIFSIIGIIINCIRLKKVEIVGDKQRWPLLYLLAAICLLSCFVLEVQVVQDANLILIDEPDGFASTYHNVVITDNAAIDIDIGEKYFKSGATECEYYEYYIIQTGFQEYEIRSPYHDPELKEIDKAIAEKIYQFSDYECSKTARSLYGDDMCFKGTIQKILGTDYYIVNWLLDSDSDNNGSGTVDGAAIFLNDTFIDDIDAGNLDMILYYN